MSGGSRSAPLLSGVVDLYHCRPGAARQAREIRLQPSAFTDHPPLACRSRQNSRLMPRPPACHLQPDFRDRASVGCLNALAA
jgi:hypothetical protein